MLLQNNIFFLFILYFYNIMDYDKITYLVWSIIVLAIIIGVSFLSNFAKNFLTESSFMVFYNWYIALIIINLFNILTNLLYHYFMKDLIGPRGLKGDSGERGLPGKDGKCNCIGTEENTTPVSISATSNIQSYPIEGGGIVFREETQQTSGSYTIDSTKFNNDRITELENDLSLARESLDTQNIIDKIRIQKENVTLSEILRLLNEQAKIDQLNKSDLIYLAELDRDNPILNSDGEIDYLNQRLSGNFLTKLSNVQIQDIPPYVFTNYTKEQLELLSTIDNSSKIIQLLNKDQIAVISNITIDDLTIENLTIKNNGDLPDETNNAIIIQLMTKEQIKNYNGNFNWSNITSDQLKYANFHTKDSDGTTDAKVIQLLTKAQIGGIPTATLANFSMTELKFNNLTEDKLVIQLLTQAQIQAIPQANFGGITMTELKLNNLTENKLVIQLLTAEQINHIFTDGALKESTCNDDIIKTLNLPTCVVSDNDESLFKSTLSKVTFGVL